MVAEKTPDKHKRKKTTKKPRKNKQTKKQVCLK